MSTKKSSGQGSVFAGVDRAGLLYVLDAPLDGKAELAARPWVWQIGGMRCGCEPPVVAPDRSGFSVSACGPRPCFIHTAHAAIGHICCLAKLSPLQFTRPVRFSCFSPTARARPPGAAKLRRGFTERIWESAAAGFAPSAAAALRLPDRIRQTPMAPQTRLPDQTPRLQSKGRGPGGQK